MSVPKVALSFAGTERHYAEAIARMAKNRDEFSVFYDKDMQAELWGKNLYETLSDEYGKKADLVVMFLSSEYARRKWPTHERRSAQSRALSEDRDYILPIRVDDTEIPGVLDTISFLDLREISIEEVFDHLVNKVSRLPDIKSGHLSSQDPIEPTAVIPQENHAIELIRAKDEIRKEWAWRILVFLLLAVGFFTSPNEEAHRRYLASREVGFVEDGEVEYTDWILFSVTEVVKESSNRSLYTLGAFGRIIDMKKLISAI